MRVHWLQHADHEGLGCMERWFAQHRCTVRGTRLQRGEQLPQARDFDWLVVMGGPMNIYEHEAHPWLVGEKALIRDACVMKKTVLGICLGAQLLADVLGGPVTKNEEQEIGWFDVVLNDEARKSRFFGGFPEMFAAFHWHGDTFAYPPGSTPLMSSEACARQAFTWGEERAVGLQFHLEVELEDARRWLEAGAPAPARYVQDAAEMLRDPARFALNTQLMQLLLERMAA